MQAPLAKFSFAELRDRLKARFVDLKDADELDLVEVLTYLNALPDDAYTPDSVDALIELATNFFFDARPADALEVASRASQLAAAHGELLLLCRARVVEGLTLTDLGRFSEAVVAHEESWELARTCGAIEQEVGAIKRVGDIWAAMAQFEVAMTYLNRSRELAVQHGLRDLELTSSNNMAFYGLHTRDPMIGLQALLPLVSDPVETKMDALRRANAHDTLGQIYLRMGDIGNARKHAHESARLAKLAGVARTIRRSETLLGLIDVASGKIDKGMAAVEAGLAFAKQVDQIDVVDCFGMCISACELAGQSDRALAYLQDLVAWKKKSIDAAVFPLQYGVSSDSASFQTGNSAFDQSLVVRSQSLQADVRQSLSRLIETAINAEVANGYDLYRIFRVAKLARCLAAELGWSEDRIAQLELGAQLCNIGMVAIPSRVLQKLRSLSEGERDVMQAHTHYGAELLRKSRLRMLSLASVIAEQHHERYDGKGYPRGLRGEAIAEEARIVAVCDAFDAMTHRRPWRASPLSIPAAVSAITQAAESQFDPAHAHAFADFIRREFWRHNDFDAFLAEGADEHEYVRVRARMDAMVAGAR